MMQTVGDVIAFWNAYFERENASGFYSDAVRVKGAEIIADDAEYWERESMRKLLDMSYAAAQKRA